MALQFYIATTSNSDSSFSVSISNLRAGSVTLQSFYANYDDDNHQVRTMAANINNINVDTTNGIISGSVNVDMHDDSNHWASWTATVLCIAEVYSTIDP